MDGVLIDSEPLHFEICNRVLGPDGHQLSRADNEEFIGTTSETMFGTLIQRWGLPRPVADYVADYDQALLEALEQPRSPQAGVARLIEHLRGRDVRLGVA